MYMKKCTRLQKLLEVKAFLAITIIMLALYESVQHRTEGEKFNL